MKKVLSFILILMVCLIPNVKADMGAPSVPTFKFYVSNSEGAYKYSSKYDLDAQKTVYTKTDEKIDYEEELELICYEYEDKDYCQSVWDWDAGNNYYIKKIDIRIINDSFSKEEGSKLDEKVYAKVFNKSGVNMYSGPNSTFYEKVGHMPYGTKFYYEYIDSQDDVDTQSTGGQWAYVTYGDVSGWVYLGMPYTGKSKIAISDTSYSVMIANDNYFIIDDINDVNDSIGNMQDDSTLKKSNIKISYGTILNSLYVYSPAPKKNYYLIKYNEKEYWLRTMAWNDDGVATKSGYYTYKINVDKDIYDNIVDKNVIGKLPANTNISDYYSHYSVPGEPNHLYIEYNGVKGWIELGAESNGEYETVRNEDIEPSIEEEMEEKAEKEEVEKIEKKKKETKKENKNEDTKTIGETKKDKNIILYCVFGAVALSLTALVVIVLKKKKKKSNISLKEENIEPNEEVSTNEEPVDLEQEVNNESLVESTENTEEKTEQSIEPVIEETKEEVEDITEIDENKEL